MSAREMIAAMDEFTLRFGRCLRCLTAYYDCGAIVNDAYVPCCDRCLHTSDPAREPEVTW